MIIYGERSRRRNWKHCRFSGQRRTRSNVNISSTLTLFERVNFRRVTYMDRLTSAVCSSWPNHPWANAHYWHVTETHAWTGTYYPNRSIHPSFYTAFFNHTTIPLSNVWKVQKKGVWKFRIPLKSPTGGCFPPFIHSSTDLLLFTAPDLWLRLSQHDPLPHPRLAPEETQRGVNHCCLVI